MEPHPWQLKAFQAFHHRLRREGKKKVVGVVSLDPVVRSMMESEEAGLRLCG